MLTAHRLATVAARLRTQLSRSDERGASLVEYALLVALIALVCIIAITFLGTSSSEHFSDVGNSLADLPN